MAETTTLKNIPGVLILFAAKILFGTTPIFLRLVPAHIFVFLLSLLFFATVGFGLSAWKELKLFLREKKWWPLFLISFAFLVQDVAYYGAVTMMDVSVGALIRSTAPVMVVASVFLIGERVTKRSIIAIAIAFAGLLTLFFSKGVAYSVANSMGIGLAFLSAISVAIYWMGAKVILRTMSPRLFIFVRSAMSFLLFVPFVWIGFPDVVSSARGMIPEIALFGILYGVVAGYLDARGIQKTMAQHAAVLAYVVPLTTVLLGIVVLNESISVGTLVGGVLILAGGYIVTTNKSVSKTAAVQSPETV